MGSCRARAVPSRARAAARGPSEPEERPRLLLACPSEASLLDAAEMSTAVAEM